MLVMAIRAQRKKGPLSNFKTHFGFDILFLPFQQQYFLLGPFPEHLLRHLSMHIRSSLAPALAFIESSDPVFSCPNYGTESLSCEASIKNEWQKELLLKLPPSS